MESSDDSFAWMSTSSDSNDSDSEDNKMSAVKTKSEEGDSTDNKKTAHKRVFDGSRAASGAGGEEEPPRKRRKKLKRERAETPAPAASPASPAVKREPASDSDSASAELARRVKEELAAAPAPSPGLTNGGHATSDTDAFVSTDRKTEKKKSKKRKKETSFDTDVKDMIVEDSFSAEETVVESRSRPRNSMTRLNQQTEGDDNDSSKVKTCPSREFVSDDSSSSDESSKKKKKKHKNKHRTSEIQHERQRSGDSDERRTEATPVKSSDRVQHEQKISDRIRYEDEDDLQNENNHHLTNPPEHQPTQATRLKRFLKANPRLKPETPCFDGDSPVTRDDEVWVLRCPHDVDISNLKGKDLQLDTKCKLKIDGQAYDGSLNEEKGTVANLSCTNNQIIINNISLIGTVNFRKRIPKPHFVQDNVIVNNQTNFIPLPDTKRRHPLFGSDYKKAMKIPSAIKERLNCEREPKLEQLEKKKKKKKQREQDYEAETAAAASHDASAPRHTHGRRLAAGPDEGDGPPPPKKHKKIKKEVSADTWESVKAIEESLFDF